MNKLLALITLAVLASPPGRADGPETSTPVGNVSAIITRHAFIGVELLPLDQPTRAFFHLPPVGGMLAIGIAPGSPADGKIAQGDILLKLDDQWLVNRDQLRALIHPRKPGDPAVFTVLRGGRETAVTLTLAECPHSSFATPSALRDAPCIETSDRPEDLLRSLTERSRSMMKSMGMHEGALDKVAGDIAVSQSSGVENFGIHHSCTRTVTRPEGRVTITERDGKRTLTVIDKSGKILVNGEVTDEAKTKLPEWAKTVIEGHTPPPAKVSVPTGAPLAKRWDAGCGRAA